MSATLLDRATATTTTSRLDMLRQHRAEVAAQLAEAEAALPAAERALAEARQVYELATQDLFEARAQAPAWMDDPMLPPEALRELGRLHEGYKAVRETWLAAREGVEGVQVAHTTLGQRAGQLRSQQAYCDDQIGQAEAEIGRQAARLEAQAGAREARKRGLLERIKARVMSA